MLTASVTNNILTIYSSDSLVGINTNLIYVFDNRIFNGINSQLLATNTATLDLARNVKVGSNVKINIFGGGLTTTGGAVSTQIISGNNFTVYQDYKVPSLIEMAEQNNYNFTSYVFANLTINQSTSENYPSANIVLKRRAPQGKITINEGYLGPMQVSRFAALSSQIFELTPFSIVSSSAFTAFDYTSYANQIITSVVISVNSNTVINNTLKYYLNVYTDYLNYPSTNRVASSSNLVDITGISNTFTEMSFLFDSLTLTSGKYWFVLTPSSDSSYNSNTSLNFYEPRPNNYYTTTTLRSNDGVVFAEITNSTGIAAKLTTERGVPLASADTVFNQLDQPQNIIPTYGDDTNLNLYTLLGVATEAHYIQKNILDFRTPIYAVETLVSSNGQNQYSVSGGIQTTGNVYFSMIANNLTTNVIRYQFNSPQSLSNIKITSLGDYYSKGPQGTVMVSAQDFLGISTIEVSTSSDFPENSTTVINLPSKPQNYLQNLDYNFGDVGKKFINYFNGANLAIKAIYAVNLNGMAAYLLMSDTALKIYQNDAITTIYQLSDSVFTSHSFGANGILFADTNGNIFNYNHGRVGRILTLSETPTALTLQATSTLIGVSSLADTGSTLTRRRIYSYYNNTLSHLSWSQQIPEPQITLLYAASFGLIIGAYDQTKKVGRVYIYANGILSLYYTADSAPNIAYFSQETSRLYVGFGGSKILFADYSNNKLGNMIDQDITPSGSYFLQLASTRTEKELIAITDLGAYLINENNFVIKQINYPYYSSDDQKGLFTSVYVDNLNLFRLPSRFILESYSNVNFDVIANGYSSSFVYNAQGYLIYPASISTSFYLQYPSNASLISCKIDGQNINITDNTFSQTFEANVPKSFELKIQGASITGVGTIALREGGLITDPLVGINSYVASKNFGAYLRTGGEYDLFGFQDSSLKRADTSKLSNNVIEVFARFTDINGVRNGADTYATDIIYTQVEQQVNDQVLPSGRILEINPNIPNTINESVTPPAGASNFIFSGTKIVRSTGIFESDPYFAADMVSWGQIQVLALIPGAVSGATNGTEVVLYVKTASSLNELNSKVYTNSYKVSTINNGFDYTASVASILANIQSLSGKWIQFKLELVSATENYAPTVKSVLITYTGANQSVFVTKTFDTALQTTLNPAPKIRRGILTANFVTNGGEISFGYTTDPSDGNALNYVKITPNQIFTLPEPSQTIKFGVILYSSTSVPCFLDDFAVQLDLGPDDVYFMPPQAAFEIQQYVDSSGASISSTYRFVNKSIGIVSSYNWTFGTTYPTGILTYYPPNEDPTAGPVANRQDPVVQFTNSGPFTVGLFITGFIQDNIVFNSDLYTKSFIAT